MTSYAIYKNNTALATELTDKFVAKIHVHGAETEFGASTKTELHKMVKRHYPEAKEENADGSLR